MPQPIDVYWDANAFQGLLNEEPDKARECQEVWNEADQGLFRIVTSTLTVAEVIYIKGTPKLDPAKRPIVNNFFRRRFIILRPVTRVIAELARDVVWDCGVAPKDAIHVATAAVDRISQLHTTDNGLIKKSDLIVNGFKIVCCRPVGSGQQTFEF